MKNKIIISLLLVLAAVVSFLVYQNYSLNKKVEQLSTGKTETNTTTTTIENIPIDPAAESPFDKNYTDPLKTKLPVVQPKNPSNTSISFERLKHDFGKIDDNQFANTKFHFTNTGSNPLFIMKAEASCGCTVPRWTREPIAPNETGEIYVQFDSHFKKGEIEKTITVAANTAPDKTVLTIKAIVIPIDK